jgi:uncharacterized protein (TIGR02231 family)
MAELETSLTAATVYPDRARLVCAAHISLDAGFHRLEIPQLPLQMNPDSARVVARGSARAQILGLQVQKVYYSQTPVEQVRQLETQLESAQDELQALLARARLVEDSRTRLDALAGHTQVFATALASGEMSVEAQLNIFAGLRARAEQLDAEGLETQAQKRAQERQVQQLEKQLEQVRNARPSERYTAFVEIEILQAGDLLVELNYLVSRADWKPLYDLRLSEEKGDAPSLEVGYLAQVTQASGENWPDVALTLSTARPALAGSLPELDPWYVRPLEPIVRTARPAAAPMMDAKASRMAEVTTTGAEPPEAEPEIEAFMLAAKVETTGAAVTYRVPGSVSIPADGAPHKVSVARFSLKPDLDYVTAPKLVEAAYRRARAANESPYTLLPGEVNLFAGDEFIGSTRIELIAPGGEIEVFLGPDDRLRVERELVRREVDKRLIGGKRRIRYGYEIRVENLLPHPARITVHDQMPVARHEDIKIRLEEVNPTPAKHSELNLLDWELGLDPGEKALVRFDFSIEHPVEMNVAGLP